MVTLRSNRYSKLYLHVIAVAYNRMSIYNVHFQHQLTLAYGRHWHHQLNINMSFQFDLPLRKRNFILILPSDFTEYLGLRISHLKQECIKNSQSLKNIIHKFCLRKLGTNLATLLSQVLFCPQLYYPVGMMLRILLEVTDLTQGWGQKKKVMIFMMHFHVLFL